MFPNSKCASSWLQWRLPSKARHEVEAVALPQRSVAVTFSAIAALHAHEEHLPMFILCESALGSERADFLPTVFCPSC